MSNTIISFKKITILFLFITSLLIRNSMAQVVYQPFTVYDLPNFEDAISMVEASITEQNSTEKLITYLPRQSPCPTQYFMAQHLAHFANDSTIVHLYYEKYLDHTSPLIHLTHQLHQGPIPIGLFFQGTYYAVIETLGGGGCVATLVLSTSFAQECPMVVKYFNCPN